MKSSKIDPLYVMSSSHICEQLEQSGYGAESMRFRKCCRGSRCGMVFCPTCDASRGQRLSCEAMEQVSAIKFDHRSLGAELLNQFDALKEELECSLLYIGVSKRCLTRWIGCLLIRVKGLQDRLDVSEVVRQLRQAKGKLRERGVSEVSVNLRNALSLLDIAVQRRLGHRFQAFTLTRRSGADYRALVVDTMDCVRQLMGRIESLGWGAMTHFHLQAGVHAHGVYWGPLLNQDDIGRSWYDITGDSDRVEVNTLATERDLIRWVSYSGRSNVEGINFWLRTRGLRLLTRYGVFRSRSDTGA